MHCSSQLRSDQCPSAPYVGTGALLKIGQGDAVLEDSSSQGDTGPLAGITSYFLAETVATAVEQHRNHTKVPFGLRSLVSRGVRR